MEDTKYGTPGIPTKRMEVQDYENREFYGTKIDNNIY